MGTLTKRFTASGGEVEIEVPFNIGAQAGVVVTVNTVVTAVTWKDSHIVILPAPAVAGDVIEVSSVMKTAVTGTGKVLQVVGKTITTQGSQTLTPMAETQVGAGTDFVMDITPIGNNSKFLVEYRWFGETQTAWDTVFNIQRDGVRVNNTGVVHSGLSMATQSHTAGNNDSTPEIMHVKTLDQTGSSVGVPVQFKLTALSTFAVQTLWTNRCFGIATVTQEQGVSEVIITEIAA